MGPNDAEGAELRARFDTTPEVDMLVRAILVVEAKLIRGTCGFVDPEMKFVKHRPNLYNWADNQQKPGGEDWAERYRWSNNQSSLEALPATGIGDCYADMVDVTSSDV